MKINYHIVKFLIGYGFRTFFQKIYFINKEYIPENGPIIFAANHPTAFIEPIVHIPFMKNYESFFILRGDYFKATWARKALNSLNIIPIFRQRDGVENMRKNMELFGVFQNLLHEDKNITIMVEGSHDYHKRLRTVQRGTARMTIGTYKAYGDDDITILPMGVSFSEVTAFRGIIYVKFGEPIVFKDYVKRVEENERKTMLHITKQIQERLRTCMVHIEQEADDEVTDQLLEMNRNSHRIPIFFAYSEEDTLLEQEIAFANNVNDMPDAKKESFKSKMQGYQEALKKQHITDLGIGKQYILNLWNTLFVFLGFPIFVLSCLVHFPLILLVKKLMGMNKKKEFVTSLGLAATSFGYPIWWLLWGIIAFIFWNKWLFIGVALLPILTYLSLFYWDISRYWRAAWQFNKLGKDKRKHLLNLREEVFAFVKPIA